MANEIIRSTARAKGVRLWELAEACGVNDSNFSRKLRRELPSAEQEKILAIIDQISGKRKEVP